MSVTQNRAAVLLDVAWPWLIDGKLHRRRHHYYCDPRDLVHRLSYLVWPLTGANDDGGGHGGSAELDNGAMPAVTMETQITTRMSIYELR